SIFFFQAEDGIRDRNVTGVQTCALPISRCRETTPWAVSVIDEGFAGYAEDGLQSCGELALRGWFGDVQLIDDFPARGEVAVNVMGEVGACDIGRLHGLAP